MKFLKFIVFFSKNFIEIYVNFNINLEVGEFNYRF